MSSPAEERIRLKAETALRARCPGARIIHELVLSQGGVRIDLAAVGPDYIVLAEIKSERDTLTRLPRQLRQALKIGDEVWLCVAPRYAEALAPLQRHYAEERVDIVRDGRVVGWTYKTNPAHVPELSSTVLMVERDGEPFPARPYPMRPRHRNPVDLLWMLWADELRHIAGPLGSTPRWSRGQCVGAIVDDMTGRQIKTAVCAALRGRPFPRADERLAA